MLVVGFIMFSDIVFFILNFIVSFFSVGENVKITFIIKNKYKTWLKNYFSLFLLS